MIHSLLRIGPYFHCEIADLMSQFSLDLPNSDFLIEFLTLTACIDECCFKEKLKYEQCTHQIGKQLQVFHLNRNRGLQEHIHLK